MVSKPKKLEKMLKSRTRRKRPTWRHFFVQYLFFAYEILVVLMGVALYACNWWAEPIHFLCLDFNYSIWQESGDLAI